MSEPIDVLRNVVGATCHRLQGDYLADPSLARHHSARATLAELRRGGSLDISKDPLALGKVLFAMQGEFSEQLAGKGDEPSPSEKAAFVALTLFGVHMQGTNQPVHVPGFSFAAACGQLNAQGTSDSIKPRIDAMLLANDEQARLTHIRSLVNLLRSKEIGFDYGLFARDIRGLSDPAKRPGIQIRWSRDFSNSYFRNNKSSPVTTES